MIQFTERLDKAIRTAAWAHEQQGQHRKGSDTPYIVHPVGVMIIANTATDDEDILIACLLHDVLEDVDSKIYDEHKMRADLGDRVTGIVLDVTKDASIKVWRKRGEAYLDHLEHEASDEAVILCASDKIHNLMSITTDYKAQGDQLWQKFTTKSATDQLWWYDSVLSVLKKRQANQNLTTRLETDIKELKILINVST